MHHLIKGLLVLGLVWSGCSDSTKAPVDSEDAQFARLRIEAFDAPPPLNVEHVYLTINEVSVHSEEKGWVSLATPQTTYDFLELINGQTVELVDAPLVPGRYTQLRLVVAETNEVVIDGVASPLRVPSGSQSGVKLNLDFEVEADELIEVFVDFDVAKSVKWTPKDYQLKPTFRAFKKVISGIVEGKVLNSEGDGIKNVLVEAVSGDMSTSTVTDGQGVYKLILPQGIYQLAASAEGYSLVEAPTAVTVEAQAMLQDQNFMFTP